MLQEGCTTSETLQDVEKEELKEWGFNDRHIKRIHEHLTPLNSPNVSRVPSVDVKDTEPVDKANQKMEELKELLRNYGGIGSSHVQKYAAKLVEVYIKLPCGGEH